MDLQAMARDISAKLEAAGFPKEEAAARQVFNLAEEVGEFVGAYRRWKGMARRKGSFDEVAKELADVVITAFVTAEELGITLESEIAAKLGVIYSRGWHAVRVWRVGDPEPVEDGLILVDDEEGEWRRRASGVWCSCADEECDRGSTWGVLATIGPLTELVEAPGGVS